MADGGDQVKLSKCRKIKLPPLRKATDEIAKVRLGFRFRGGVVQAIDPTTGEVWVVK
jgi:hypothetical protein